MAGFLATAAPVASDRYRFSRPIMLIGQAPGQVEAAAGEPFMGRAGRTLFRWLERVGVSERDFREQVYITSVTKCFPGKAPGDGDRRPGMAELRLCRPFLDEQLEIVMPSVLLLAGRMAIDLYLPRLPLEQAVGRSFRSGDYELIPLPHPSGASRWLNSAANRERLERALDLVKDRLLRQDSTASEAADQLGGTR